MSKEELYETFVARKKLLDELLKTTKDNTGKKSIQHIILLGARGIGKTHMLQMIENKVADSTQLRSNWITVKIPEEQYGVFSLVDFFKYILEVILNSSQLENTHSGTYKEELEKIKPHKKKEALDKLVSILKDISKKENRQFLLLVDNIDKILTEKIAPEEEQEYFRSILMTEKFMMIIGTSTTVFEEIASYDKAFFRFFKTIHLKNLTDKEVEQLLLRRAELDGAVDRIKLNENRTKIRAITDLTGGYPRLVLMLYEILEDKPLLDVLKTFNRLLDNLTPYYQHRMADLSPQQQKIIDEIMLSEGIASPTDIARKVGWKQTIVTSQFKRLKDINILQVREGETKKRKSYYDISDRLFVIWYQMRYLGVLREHIEYIVTFLKIWYDFEELKDKISRYSDQYQLHYSLGDISVSYDYIRSISIMNCAIEDAAENEKIYIKQIKRYMNIGKIDDALKEAKELLKIHKNRHDRKFIARDYGIIGSIHNIHGEFEKARTYHIKALKIYEKINNKEGIAQELKSIGLAYQMQNEMIKAIEYHQKAVKIYQDIDNEIGIAQSFSNIGMIYQIQDNLKRAADYHQRALKIHEKNNNRKGVAEESTLIGIVHVKQGDLKNALKYHKKALKIYGKEDKEIDVKIRMAIDYNNIGYIYTMKSDLKNAIEYHQKALKIYETIDFKAGVANTLTLIGMIYQLREELEKALEYYNNSIKFFKNTKNHLKYNLFIKNKIDVLLKLATKNNKEKNTGEAIENIKKLSKCLKETKDEETIKMIGSELFNLLIDSEYDFVITILETLEKEHKEVVETCTPFTLSAKYLKTKDASIFEDKNSLLVDATKKVLETVEKEKKEKSKQISQKKPQN